MQCMGHKKNNTKKTFTYFVSVKQIQQCRKWSSKIISIKQKTERCQDVNEQNLFSNYGL